MRSPLPIILYLSALGTALGLVTPLPRDATCRRQTSKPFTLFSAKALAKLESLRIRYAMPSYTLAVVGKDSRNQWIDEQYALGSMDAKGTKADDKSLYAIGSNSKLFTVLSIGMLIDNKTVLPSGEYLALDTKMKAIFPDWELIDKEAEANVTLHDLLSMRSGVPRHDIAHGVETPAQLVTKYKYLRPSEPLGSTYQYSNGHYFVLSEVVATLSGVPFVDYVQNHILSPLNMTQTFYNATDAAATGHRAEGFFRQDVDRVACAKGWNTTGQSVKECVGRTEGMGWWVEGDGVNEAGAGGLSSCTQDMTKWLKELLNPQVLSAEWIKKAYEPSISTGGSAPASDVSVQIYGMGQWTYNYRGVEIVEHGGGVPGFVSLHVRIPSRNLAFLISTNDQGPGAGVNIMYTAAWLVLDDILGLSPRDWESQLMIAPLKAGPPAASLIPLPTSPQPAPDAASIIGNYSDAGYGNLDLVQASNTVNDDYTGPDPVQALLAYLKRIPPGPLNFAADAPIYVAKVDKVFSSYLVFTHFDGPVFIWTNVIARAIPGDSEGRLSFFTQGLGQAVIMPGQGVGMYGNFWGGKAGKTPTGKVDPKVESEVWYARSSS